MLNNKKKAKEEAEVSENKLKMLKAPALEVSKLEEPIEMPKLEKPTERLKLEMKENVPLKKKSRKRTKK